MTLLSMHEIQRGLDKEFAPLEPMLTGLRIIRGGLSDAALDTFELKMNMALPLSFREFVKEYDFGRITIGPVVFSNGGDYISELTHLNTDVEWWGAGFRPVNLLMIANSDPFAILLNLASGELLAMDVERGWKVSIVIASSFDLFVRGVGTTILSRNHGVDRAELGRFIASTVGSSEESYWLQLAK